ncbi:hypothetical protein SAMN04487905_106214 [Actinopolyspora xinjiangensis]|uniref:Uncharacterized protein n=1 Tax=Actinopolyspora xinjiangensis TaxID=405564 RepID=A0A1H0UEB1_9ACTN|nr:hypothetical protein [Actinopolyspora xinjiangensis]SDP64206.1 hypothetical protein SAMN04487905_106214 [Actinopolyspora xinjiangensis]
MTSTKPDTPHRSDKVVAFRYISFTVLVGLVFWVSIPFGYAPLLLGLVLLGAGFLVRRRDPGLARVAQIVGATITVVGLVILSALVTSTSSGGGGPQQTKDPYQTPVQR